MEIVSHCHTLYGRFNKMPSAVEMLKWERDHSVNVAQVTKLSPEEMKDKFVTGVLQDRDIPEYTDVYERVIERANQRYAEDQAASAVRGE